MTIDGLDELECTIDALSVDAAVDRLRLDTEGDPQRVHELIELANRLAHSDATRARHALDVGDRLAVEFRCPEALPASKYLRARLTLNNGQPDAALGLIAEARSEWSELDRPLDAYRTDLGRMAVLDDLGRHGEAADVAEALLADLDALERSRFVDEELNQLEWIWAAANENLGIACGFTGRHLTALDAYRLAEERYEEIGGLEDMARCRANRGVELVAIGRAVEGLEVLQSAAVMFDELDDHLDYAQCLGYVADAELLLGLYAAALSRYEEARALLDSMEARSEGCRIRLRTVRAYLALNLVDEAEVLAGQTEEVLVELGLQHDIAEARWLWAVAQLRAGRPDEAIERLDQAIDGAVESNDPPLLIKALLTKSEALGETGDNSGAEAAGAQALAVVGDGDWPTEELHVQLRLAQLLGDADAVDQHLRRAEQLADELGLPHLRYPVLLELGRHRLRQGMEAEARSWLREAVDVVEGLRGRIPDEAVRTSYLEGRTAAHVDLMSILISNGSDDDLLAAFDLAEASKARTLDDILAGVVQPNPAVDSSSSAVLRHYEADLNAAYSSLSSGGVAMTRERRKAVQDRAIELEKAIRLAHLQTETRSGDPADGPSVRSVPSQPSAVEQVVEYHVVGDRIVAFAWSNGRLEVVTLDASVEEIAGQVGQWDRNRQRFQVATQVGNAGSEQLVVAAEETLRQLWLTVLAPVLPYVDSQDVDLLIVPHGPLHAVPFHALMGPDGPVGRQRTISLAPSYAVAGRLRGSSWAERHGSSLILGVPDEAAPAVDREARAVAGALRGGDLLLGQEATVDALVEGTQRQRDVLHLACHGLHRARNPMFSALKLADRWLTARDVLGLRLNGTLVVLSACETGRQGGHGSQDEAIGLARSFLAAGASAVVVSLWLAGDEVTAKLMQHFYSELNGGLSPAAALRVAQTSVQRTNPHPSDWAPFVIHGGGQGES